MSRTIGIDLGTTNSCVAIVEGGQPTIIPNRQGARTTPSVVAFTEQGDVLVGSPAKRQAVTNPARTVYGAKRLIGRKHASAEVSSFAASCPYPIVPAPNGDAWISVGERTYGPQEISAYVLEYLRGAAEDYLGEEVKQAVITVPAYYNESQRQATKDAGAIAGREVLRIFNEPTAAALAYGVEKEGNQRLAVFDLGGGTFDISIMEVHGGVFEVLATNGDTFLGGDDFDRRLIDMLVDHCQKQTGVELEGDAMAMQRLKEAAEAAKHELSVSPTSSINLPFIATHEGAPVHLIYDELTRAAFEGLVQEELGRLEEPCLKALADAGLGPDQIDRVILVGGMTRMPAVQERVVQIFGKKPARDVNADEAIAMGAALQSSVMSGELREVVLLDVTPHSLGLRVVGDRFSRILERNSRIPCREKKLFVPVKDDQDFVTLEIYQGESDDVRDNHYLGRFTLGGLTRKDGTVPNVEVCFTMDADGLLHVAAVEVATGKAAAVEIQPSGGLSPQQIDRMVEERHGGQVH
ncbi:MAG: molecular chaperone DnaK [Deltaproteobacteria bacterium]|nr:molecular chaperone DnaK [Deltaproteobacteria bacterium]